MAEKAVVAFGRYLKLLRERRRLSLDDVVALTKAYPEPINKGYLSRAERGLSHIAFSKIVALGRAYEVPVDVFGEKLSLDLEVEQLKDAPETEGRSFGELVAEGSRLGQLGLRLHAYAAIRDALPRASSDSIIPNYRDRAEQLAAAAASHAVVAGWLSRLRLSQHEVDYAISLRSIGPELAPAVSMQLAVVYRRAGEIEKARTYADAAITEAEAAPSQRFLGDAFSVRAFIASLEGDTERAIALCKQALSRFRESHHEPESARAMANLANAYFAAGRLRAARRAADVAARRASQIGAVGVVLRAQILQGEIDLREGKVDKAVNMWLTALQTAKRTHDRVAAFKAEFQLYKNALHGERLTAANALGRRLNRLWPWIAADEPEVAEFRALWARYHPAKRRRVVDPQHGGIR